MSRFFSRMGGSCLCAAALLSMSGVAAAATDCPGFKTGMVRVMHFGGVDSVPMWIDAQAMTATADDLTYTITKNAQCDYSISDGIDAPVRMLVWSSGMAVLRRSNVASPDDVSLVLPTGSERVNQ